MSNPSAPEFVYRLVSAAEWRDAKQSGIVPKCDIDLKDGYMHLSTRQQVLETARLHFAGVDDLMALEIPFAGIADDVKFELAPKRGEAFPHLYRVLRYDDVAAVWPLLREGATFKFGEPE